MSDLFTWLPADGFPRFAFDAVWQSTLCAVLAVIVLRFTRQPALRAAVALIAIALSLALPTASWSIRRAELGAIVVAAPHRASERPAPASVTRLAPDSFPAVEMQAIAPGLNAATQTDWSEAICTLFGLFWGGATALLLLRVALSALALRRWLLRATPCDDAELGRALRCAAERLQVAAPRIAFSPDVGSPTIVPFFRPTLLLSCESRSTPSEVPGPERWQIIAEHELAHLRRRDGWAKLLIELCAAALPWQPGVWWLRRSFAAAAEDACDDWAVAAGANPVTIAAVLTELVPIRSLPGLGVAMLTTDARTRIRRLLALREPVQPTASRRTKIALLACAALAAAAIAIAQPVAAEPQGEEVQSSETDSPNADDDAKRDASEQELAPEYVIEPPDVLLIDLVRLVPKAPYKTAALDVLRIQGAGLLPEEPLAGIFAIEPGGRVNLGPSYGSLDLSGLSLEEAQEAIVKHLQQNVGIRTPEISVTLAASAGGQMISGEHLVGPDGRVILGSYGSVFVAGKTLQEARAAIETHLADELDDVQISIDVFKYNSKFYYIILEDEVAGDEVIRMPITGNETVLDAVAVANERGGVRVGPKTEIWIARRSEKADADHDILPVDLRKIVRGQSAATNYRLRPHDRVFLSRPLKTGQERTPVDDSAR